MKEVGYKIFWNGEFVGEMLEPNLDMFFSYGKWKPTNSTSTEKFLNELKNEEQLIVRFDDPVLGLAGIVETFPDKEIEVTHYPNLD